MSNRTYNLEERTAKFGEAIISFASKLKETSIIKSLVGQIVRSGTSIGANYMEADWADSKKDFRHKIGICKRESKETMHWLRMIAKADSKSAKECRSLWKEAHELALIFSSIVRRIKQ